MATYVTESFPLRKGMKGTNTMTLQSRIGVTADGYFGDATEQALSKAYGVTTCSQELFTKITNGSNNTKKRGFMNLTEATKKKLKVGGLILGGLGIGYGIYKLVSKHNKKEALNGVRRRKKRKKSLGRVSHKVINLT